MFELLVWAGLCSAFSAPNITEAKSVLAAVGNDDKSPPVTAATWDASCSRQSSCSRAALLSCILFRLLVVLGEPWPGLLQVLPVRLMEASLTESPLTPLCPSVCVFWGSPAQLLHRGKMLCSWQLGDNNQLTVPSVITKEEKKDK